MKRLFRSTIRKSLLAFILFISFGLSSCTVLQEPSTNTTPNPDPETNISTSETDAAVDTDATDMTDESETSDELELTLDELLEFDGKDGRKAYVAVDGIIYDFTELPRWADGEHANQFTAGHDLTDEIDNDSPHGRDVLSRAPVVGKLVEP